MYSCNGQKVVGQSNFFSLHLSVFDSSPSLDDFIDARLGRKPTNLHNMHNHHLFDSAPNSTPVSARASTTTISAPPDSPALIATQTLMNDEETAAGEAPITPTQQHTQRERVGDEAPHQQSMQQDPLSRSARIRAFRAFQHASPEEKERMRGDWVGGAGANAAGDNPSAGRTRGGEWTAVHLLSADEVKSLFKDVVEGLRFLVLFFFVFCFIAGLSNLCVWV